MQQKIIKTAEQHQRDIERNQRKTAKEKREHARKMQELKYARQLRDDVVSHLKNSRHSYEYIEQEGGPKIATLMNWQEGRVDNPRLSKLESALRIVGKRLVIGDL